MVCAGVLLAGPINAQPRSTQTLADDDSWLQSIATHVRETSVTLAKAAAAASAASATKAACAASAGPTASAKPSQAMAAASTATANAAASPSSCTCIAAKVPEIEDVTTRVSAWDAAALPTLKRLVLREKLSVLPTVDVNIAFDEARVTVSSGWIDAMESVVRAEKLSSILHSDACYRAYLERTTQVMQFDSDDLVRRGLVSPRLAPSFDVFAEHAEIACRPLLSRSWASPPLDVRKEVETGLIWWIGHELSFRPPTRAMSADERAGKLLVALNLSEDGIAPIKALCQSSANNARLARGK